MKSAAELIKGNQSKFQESPLRRQFGKKFIDEAHSNALTQIESEWAQLVDKCCTPLHIVLMGQVKSGKSTVLNAIVGREVSPVNVTEATACIIEVSYAAEETAEIVQKDGSTTQNSPEKIIEILSEKQNEQEFFAQCELVRMQMPLRTLKGFFLVDTPGLATMTEQNALRTQAYFQNADVVLWILNGNYLGNSDVNDELRKVAKMGKPIVAILNRIDEYEEDIEECLEYVRREMGIYVQEVLPLSAKKAFLALQTADSKTLEESGFTKLMDYLETKIERHADEVHNESLLSSAKALLGRELLLHKECLAEIEGKQLIIRTNQDRLMIKSQMTRDTHRNKVQVWFAQEFLSEKEERLIKKIEEMSLLETAFGSGSQEMQRIIADLFSESEVRREIDLFLVELDRTMKEDWQNNIKTVQQEVAVDFDRFQQQYLREAQAIAQSLPSAGKSALSGVGEGVAVAGVAGTALASYSALLGPMSAYVSMGSALSATLPPLLLAGAAAGALIGIFNFKKEKNNYRRVVAEIVGKIRESAKMTAIPALFKVIDTASANVAESVQVQVVGAEFGGLNPAEVEEMQAALRHFNEQLENMRTNM